MSLTQHLANTAQKTEPPAGTVSQAGLEPGVEAGSPSRKTVIAETMVHGCVEQQTNLVLFWESGALCLFS